MYQRILAAVDESEIAQRVLAATQELATLAGSEVWIIHARELEPSKYLPSSAESEQDAQALVNAAVQKLAGSGIATHPEVVHTISGYVAREIINCAKAHDIGVIVIGSRGRGDLAGLLAGSTTHKVIQLADRPVLVVR